MRLRKSIYCNRSRAEVMSRVLQYFGKEKLCQNRSELGKGIQRTVKARGFQEKVVSNISSEIVATIWKFQDADSVRRNRSMNVPKKYDSVDRQVVRDLLLEKKKVRTLDNILTKIKSLNVSDPVQRNLVDNQIVPGEEEKSGFEVVVLATDTYNLLISSMRIKSVIMNK